MSTSASGEEAETRGHSCTDVKQTQKHKVGQRDLWPSGEVRFGWHTDDVMLTLTLPQVELQESTIWL